MPARHRNRSFSPSKIVFLWALSLVFGCWNDAWSKPMLVSIEGEIEPGVVRYLERGLEVARSNKASTLIVEINTFGGRLDSAYEIVELLSAFETKTVGFVRQKAISAGALIALSCDDFYMMPETTIGDCAPIMALTGEPVMLGEKFQSPLRAKFRALAVKNGYPVKLAEAMVSIDWEVLEVTWRNGKKDFLTRVEYDDLSRERRASVREKKTIVAKGELLTMNNQEAIDLGFSSGTLDDPKGILEAEEAIAVIERSLPERIYFASRGYLSLLILIGLAALYLEFRSPGFGFYGVVGLLAFLTFFAINNIVSLSNYYELILLVVGCGLLAVELFVLPGFGVFGIAGIALVLGSLLLMMQDFVLPENPMQFEVFKENLTQVLGAFLISIPFFVVVALVMTKFLPKFSSSLVIVKPSENDAKAGEQPFKPTERLDSDYPKVGDTGIATTTLRTAGKVLVRQTTWDAISKKEFIAKGTPVVVVEVSRYRLVVEPTQKT